MNILFVNASYYPEKNGTVTSIDYLGKEFEKIGIKTFYVVGGKKENKKIKKLRTIFYFKLPNKTLKKEKVYATIEKNFAKKLNKTIDPKKIDLVITRSHIFIKELKKLFPENKIMFILPALMNINKKFKQKIEIESNKKELKAVLKGIKIVTVSKNLKKQLEKIVKTNKIKVIYPGIDRERFKPGIDRENKIVFVGRISKEKNISELIKIFLKLKVSAKLEIIGNGPDFKIHSKKFKNNSNIIFLGEKNNPEKYLSTSKVFFLPSIYESFGNVLLESMASGTPCIAFKPSKKYETASDEIIVNGENGYLVKSESDAIKKIELILNNSKIWEKLSKNSIKTAKRFDWKKTSEEILKFSNDKG